MAETPTSVQRLAAETVGTFVLVLLGCGAAVTTGADIVATGLTFGVAVLIMAYAFGRVSGGHFNPAVTVGAAVSGRLPWRQVPAYVGSQLVGALLAALVLFVLFQGFPGYDAGTAMGQNAYGGESANNYAWWAAFLLELVLTAVFLMVILAVTDERFEHPALAPLAIGFTLAAIHFMAIPATGTSVNPARSIGPALFAGWSSIGQLWLFILAPLIGGALAGLAYPALFGRVAEPVAGSGLVFRRAPAAGAAGAAGVAPGYGAPDKFQQQWNQEEPDATQAIPQDAGTGAGTSTAATDTGAGLPREGEAPPRIVQDGWEWDYAAQQWKPAQEPPVQE